MASNVASSVWLTRAEVADRLRLPKGTLDQWASREPRRGPKFAVLGRHARYRLSDVIAWENAQLEEEEEPAAELDDEPVAEPADTPKRD